MTTTHHPKAEPTLTSLGNRNRPRSIPLPVPVPSSALRTLGPTAAEGAVMDDLTFGAALLRLYILTGEAENPGGLEVHLRAECLEEITQRLNRRRTRPEGPPLTAGSGCVPDRGSHR